MNKKQQENRKKKNQHLIVAANVSGQDLSSESNSINSRRAIAQDEPFSISSVHHVQHSQVGRRWCRRSRSLFFQFRNRKRLQQVSSFLIPKTELLNKSDTKKKANITKKSLQFRPWSSLLIQCSHTNNDSQKRNGPGKT